MAPHGTQEITSSPSGRKTYLTTTNPYESLFGYHRAVRKGPFITVSGTTAVKFETELSAPSPPPPSPPSPPSPATVVTNTNDLSDNASAVHFPNDAREQAKIAMQRCIDAVRSLGGQLEDIVRVRMFVARSEDCNDIGMAFRECFSADAHGVDDELSANDQQGAKNHEVGAAATMIVVHDGFISPDMLVEVEVDAIVL